MFLLQFFFLELVFFLLFPSRELFEYVTLYNQNWSELQWDWKARTEVLQWPAGAKPLTDPYPPELNLWCAKGLWES